MENTMTQYAVGTMPIREAIAEQIRDLPSKSILTGLGILVAMSFAAYITTCITKTNVAAGRGRLEITHQA